MSHKDVLNKLIPLDLEGDADLDLEVEGKQLDEVQARGDDLLVEMFPNTTAELLPDWEELYDLKQAEKPDFQRSQNLLSAVNDRGGITNAVIVEAVRPFVGYDVVVEEYMVFRCDDPRSLTDSGLYAFDEDGLYTTTVYIDNALITTDGYDPAAVIVAINKVKQSHVNVVLDTGLYGFFCDDPNSLTDLTLLAK